MNAFELAPALKLHASNIHCRNWVLRVRTYTRAQTLSSSCLFPSGGGDGESVQVEMEMPASETVLLCLESERGDRAKFWKWATNSKIEAEERERGGKGEKNVRTRSTDI